MSLPLTRALSRTAEQEVLLLCARTRLTGTASERLKEALDEPLDWDTVLSLTGGHHTTALLYHHLSAVAPEKVPAVTLSNLRTYCLHLAARNLRVVGESISLLRDLKASGAPAVVWKGPALAYSVYPHPELRTFTDLDILVRRQDVSSVRRVLKAREYLPRHKPMVSEEELFSRGSEVVTMWNREAGIGVDVHWGATRRSLSLVMDCDRLWAQSRSLLMAGTWIRVLDPEWMLLALCVHGAKHWPYPWPKLKWLTDVEAIARALPPERWGPLLSSGRQTGCHRMLLLGLSLAKDLLEAPLSPEVEEALAKDPMVATLSRPIRERMLRLQSPPLSFAERLRFELAVRERRRDRVVYAFAQVLRPSERDQIATPPSLRFLQVPLRLVRLGGRYLLNPSRAKAFLLGSGESQSRPKRGEND